RWPSAVVTGGETRTEETLASGGRPLSAWLAGTGSSDGPLGLTEPVGLSGPLGLSGLAGLAGGVMRHVPSVWASRLSGTGHRCAPRSGELGRQERGRSAAS